VCRYARRLVALCGPARARELPVFVATDDLAAVEQLRGCREAMQHNWSVVPFGHTNPTRGEAGGVVFRLWAEVTLLVEAAFVVGTFSSNTGRLVQLLRTQPEETFASLDWPQKQGRFPRYP
jgi:hypothetical protein